MISVYDNYRDESGYICRGFMEQCLEEVKKPFHEDITIPSGIFYIDFTGGRVYFKDGDKWYRIYDQWRK